MQKDEFLVLRTGSVRIDGFSLNDPQGLPLFDQQSNSDTITNNGNSTGVTVSNETLSLIKTRPRRGA